MFKRSVFGMFFGTDITCTERVAGAQEQVSGFVGLSGRLSACLSLLPGRTLEPEPLRPKIHMAY